MLKHGVSYPSVWITRGDWPNVNIGSATQGSGLLRGLAQCLNIGSATEGSAAEPMAACPPKDPPADPAGL
jgi:hypothetical protein